MRRNLKSFSHPRDRGRNFARLKKILILILILIVVIIISRFIFILLNKKDVRVESGDLSCVSRVDLEKSLSKEVKSIFFYKPDEIERKIKEKYYCIAALEFKRNKLERLSIKVTERVAVAVFKQTKVQDLEELVGLSEATASSMAANLAEPDFSITTSTESASFLVDEMGVVLSRLEMIPENNLPLIYFASEDLEVGRVILQNKVKGIINLIKKLKELEIEPKTVKVTEVMVLIDAKPKLIFGLNRDLNYQLASLQLILQKAKMNSGSLSANDNKNKQIEMVNLRFDKPVVRYNR